MFPNSIDRFPMPFVAVFIVFTPITFFKINHNFEFFKLLLDLRNDITEAFQKPKFKFWLDLVTTLQI